jgi:DNA (cytosine-5)-methyltransferase 1
MKILNLYAGIGGNRKNWGNDHEITAIENDPDIAKIYQDFFPNDKVIIADAHQYLLENFQEFDFIWSSPPCPSHSRIRKCFVGKNNDGQNDPIYPSMKLYEEILFLQGYFKGKWVVENVVAWYEPLIKPSKIADHYFWSNFNIRDFIGGGRKHYGSIEELSETKGFDLKDKKVDKRLALRNCVEPELGLHILKEALKEENKLF